MKRIDYDVYVEGGYREDEDFGVAAFIIIDANTQQEFDTGTVVVHQSSSMRIFIEGAIAAMRKVPYGATIRFICDATYLVNVINHKWQIKANGDLWSTFESLARNQVHSCCAEWRGIKTGDVLLRKCWAMSSDVAGLDFIKAFIERFNKKYPAPHGEG